MTSRRNRTSQNRVGQRFGNLLVIAEGERIRYPGDPAHGRRTAVCKCDCGETINVRMDVLTTGKKKKCSRYCNLSSNLPVPYILSPSNNPNSFNRTKGSTTVNRVNSSNNLIVKIIKIIKNFIIKLFKR